MMEQLNNIQSKTKNQQEFLLAIEKAGIQTYSRNAQEVTGIYATNSKRKFRFKTLGIDIHKEQKEEKKKEQNKDVSASPTVKSNYQERLDRLKGIREHREQENELEL